MLHKSLQDASLSEHPGQNKASPLKWSRALIPASVQTVHVKESTQDPSMVKIPAKIQAKTIKRITLTLYDLWMYADQWETGYSPTEWCGG